MRCKACDKIMEGADFSLSKEKDQYEELCSKCRRIADAIVFNLEDEQNVFDTETITQIVNNAATSEE